MTLGLLAGRCAGLGRPVAPSRSPCVAIRRRRILAGMAAALREDGVADVAMADIARHANVSRRVVQRAFADKDSCVLALAEAESVRHHAMVCDAIDRLAPWPRQVDQGIGAYLGAVAQDAGLSRALILELATLGARADRLHDEAIERYAELVAALAGVSMDKAVMLVAGLRGLVVNAVIADESLPDLAPAAAQVFKAALAPA
jgi:AcrR family transcriptional regulator